MLGCFPGDKFYNRNSMHFLSVTLGTVKVLYLMWVTLEYRSVFIKPTGLSQH